MRRKMWMAVTATALVLIIAGGVPSGWGQPPAELRSWLEIRLVEAQTELSWLQWPGSLPHRSGPIMAALLTLLVPVALALAAWRPPDRITRVLRLARRGGSTASIAARTRMARDAVRWLIRPQQDGLGAGSG